jgi:hypothetical protein
MQRGSYDLLEIFRLDCPIPQGPGIDHPLDDDGRLLLGHDYSGELHSVPGPVPEFSPCAGTGSNETEGALGSLGFLRVGFENQAIDLRALLAGGRWATRA